MRKFLFAGREFFGEMKGAVQKGKGKMIGMIFLIVLVLVGTMKINILGRNSPLAMYYFSAVALGELAAPGKHKITYLLPVTRKEYANIIIWKSVWMMLMIWCYLWLCVLIVPGTLRLEQWGRLVALIPISMSLGLYSVMEGLDQIKRYHISVWPAVTLVLLVLIYGFADRWGNTGYLFYSLINVVILIICMVFLQKRLAEADVYYDEIEGEKKV